MPTKYYAVAVGQQIGIFETWAITQPLVKGFSGAKYKSFRTYNDALTYLDANKEPQCSTSDKTEFVDFVSNSSSNAREVEQVHTKRAQELIPTITMKTVEKGRVFYTDGSCVEKYGGFGIVIVDDGEESGTHNGPLTEYPTTNNRSELFAILTVVSNYQGDLLIRTDSKYCIDGLTKHITHWMQNGWKTSKGGDVKNTDMIKEIHKLSQGRSVIFQHVYGHTGDKYNEVADKLASLGRANH